jgi:hypothetical protein
MNNGLPMEVDHKLCQWQLIKKAEEEKYATFKPAEPQPRLMPAYVEPPPLLKVKKNPASSLIKANGLYHFWVFHSPTTDENVCQRRSGLGQVNTVNG